MVTIPIICQVWQLQQPQPLLRVKVREKDGRSKLARVSCGCTHRVYLDMECPLLLDSVVGWPGRASLLFQNMSVYMNAWSCCQFWLKITYSHFSSFFAFSPPSSPWFPLRGDGQRVYVWLVIYSPHFSLALGFPFDMDRVCLQAGEHRRGREGNRPSSCRTLTSL